MSVEVKITTPSPIMLNLESMLGEKYFATIRDPYDRAWPEAIAPVPSNDLVIFSSRRFGRGVDLNFLSSNTIQLVMHTPGATVDLEVFTFLLKKLVKKLKPAEIICDDETFAVENIDKIEKKADENLKMGMELLLSDIVKESPIEIIAYKGPISIDEEERAQFLGGQVEFDEYLDKKMSMPGTNELLAPMVAKTDRGTIWALVGLKAGRYMILPKEACSRNRNIKADYYVVFNEHGKPISYEDFLREVDTSNRFDAERFIIKFTKKELEDIFNKYPEGLPRNT